ncbi:MAG TPA: DnaJ domain-containing protein [Desulfobacterales bacterium]|nr:DnaJ domain-containing protein [Desulfobacterales bacterium]
MEQKDYYKILGIEKNATDQQIKNVYRRLAFKYHPDRNILNSETVEKMKSVNEAYAVLSNPKKRSEYDLLRQQFGYSAHQRFRKNYSDQDIFSGSDLDHIFEEMAKTAGLRGFDDIFKEFYGPKFRTFEFHRPGLFGRGFVFFSRKAVLFYLIN